MADIGFRKKGDTGPMYNPERDYAYITPTLMRSAIEKLETDNSLAVTKWREQEKITAEELNAAVAALANAQRDFVNAADPVASFEQALMRHNFYDCRHAVRQYIFATIGEVFCAAWFKAVREVSIVGEESPAQNDMARFCATVREFVNKNRGVTHDANFVAEHLRMQQDVLRAREQVLVAELRARVVELEKCNGQLKACADKKPSIFTRVLNAIRKKR